MTKAKWGTLTNEAADAEGPTRRGKGGNGNERGEGGV